jgi:type IV secretion system protein VirD4
MNTELAADFPRGCVTRKSGVGPSAHFESSENVANAASLQFSVPNTAGKIYLGVVGAEIIAKRLIDGRMERYAVGGVPVGIADDRHIFTGAGTRSGKGRDVILPNLIHYPGSVLATDPKGELASLTAAWRAEVLGQRVVVLDPFQVAGEVSDIYGGVFNPLSFLAEGSQTLVEDAGLIADALIVPAQGSSDPHWDESARLFLEGLILHVATYPPYEGRRDLLTVYHCGMSADGDLEAEMMENPSADFAVIEAARSFYDKPDTERGGVLSSLRRHIRFLGYSQMAKVLRGSSFDLSQLKTGKTTLYLCLPAMRMGTCSRWLRLFINLSLASFETIRTRPEHPVLFCLDEFPVLGRMATLETAAGQLAGLGCKLWPIVQDLGQLKALYGQRWETFLGNAGILQFFGNSDTTTLEWLEKRLGTTTIQTKSRRNPSYSAKVRDGDTGESYNQQVHPLMTAEEISRFFGREDHHLRQLIIRPSGSPIVLQRAHYDSHELFADYRKFMSMEEQ